MRWTSFFRLHSGDKCQCSLQTGSLERQAFRLDMLSFLLGVAHYQTLLPEAEPISTLSISVIVDCQAGGTIPCRVILGKGLVVGELSSSQVLQEETRQMDQFFDDDCLQGDQATAFSQPLAGG